MSTSRTVTLPGNAAAGVSAQINYAIASTTSTPVSTNDTTITPTAGAAVAGSAATTITTPAADSLNQVVGSDFAAPTAGWYCLGFVQSTATIAASSHLHITAQLQMRNN